MDSETGWELFMATGLPEAYTMFAWVRQEEQEMNEEQGTKTA